MKLYITAMAENKKHLEFILHQQAKQIVRHIAKIIILDNDSNNHWMTEVHGLIDSIPRFRHNKKYPNKNFIFKNTYGTVFDIIDNLTKASVSVSSVRPTQEEIEIVYKVCKDYFNWLSSELSSKGYIEADKVKSLLSKLVDKYKG